MESPLAQGIETQAENAIIALLKGFGLDGAKALPVLLRVAEKSGSASSNADAFNRVRLRSVGAENKILEEEGGLVSDAQFASALGLKARQSVHNYRVAKKIFALPKGGRNFVYAAWQVHKRALLPGLEETLAVLAKKRVTPIGIVLFFLTPAETLGEKRPLDLLRRGVVEEVILHARRYR